MEPKTEEKERLMFGTTLAKVKREKPARYSPELWAISILSDVQELVQWIQIPDTATYDRVAQVIWLINKAKYWVMEASHDNETDETD